LKKSVKAFAPATVANVSCGFDVLGFAIEEIGDYVTAQESQTKGVHIAKIIGDMGKLSTDAEANTAGVAVMAMLDAAGVNVGVELIIEKNMPLESGMGSSAASAAAAVVAVNQLLGLRFNKRELVKFAMAGEAVASGIAHADNVAPSLLGGFVLIPPDYPGELVSLPYPDDLQCIILHPHISVKTSEARKAMPSKIPVSDAIAQVANMGVLVTGLFCSNNHLIAMGLKDHIAEPVRSAFIPGFDAVRDAALKAGALGSGISGSGPSIFALYRGNANPQEIALAMSRAAEQNGLQSDLYITSINRQGAKTLEEENKQ
jgi:homoserine kinase